MAGCNIRNSLHETNEKSENLNSTKLQLRYHHATYYNCSYVVNFIQEYFMETELRLKISRVAHGTYSSVPSLSNLCLSHLIPSHGTFPMGFPWEYIPVDKPANLTASSKSETRKLHTIISHHITTAKHFAATATF